MAQRSPPATRHDGVIDPPTYADRHSGRVYRDAIEMVNDYLRRFGESVDLEVRPLDTDGYTKLRKGSAEVGVNVLEDHGILLLLSKIMEVPADRPERLYRKLLELNFLVTSDAAFAIDRDREVIYLRAHRRLGGLDFEEFDDLLSTTAATADEWDDRLTQLFSS